MNTLALDPATRTGWAHSNGTSGVWDLGCTSQEHAGNKLVRLVDRIAEVDASLGIDRIVYEAAAFGSKFVATKQFHNGMRGVIQYVAARMRVPFEEYSPTTLKKFATGHGGAIKADMIRTLNAHFGLNVTDDNQADAIWLLKLDEHRQTHQLDVLREKLRKPKVARQVRKKDPQLF